MARDDDERPAPKPAHVIGQDLSLLSVAECEARIALLQDEIARLNAALAGKRDSRAAAARFFKT